MRPMRSNQAGLMIKADINCNYIYYPVGEKNLIKMCFLKHSQQSLTFPFLTELQMPWPIPYYTCMLGFESMMFDIADSSIWLTLGGGSACYTHSTVKAMLTWKKID